MYFKTAAGFRFKVIFICVPVHGGMKKIKIVKKTRKVQ